jgi:rubredoxin
MEPPGTLRTVAGANVLGGIMEIEMDRYRCIVCGYVYDPKKGDVANGIKAGTTFQELPADWVCPVCGVDKNSFERVEDYVEVEK